MKIDDITQTNFKSVHQKAVVNIRFTSNYLSNSQNIFMARFGITMAQFNILRILRGAKKAINVNTVKERMIEKSPNTTRLMDKLLDKKLITRTHSKKDRRVVFVEISLNGLALLSEIDVQMEETKLIPDNLTDEEAETLSNLLDKLREGVE